MADVKQWITVKPNGKENKGQPIPVMEGQTKGEAVKSFVKSKTGKEYRQNTSYGEIQEKTPLEDNHNAGVQPKQGKANNGIKASELAKGKLYRQKVDSQQGYEDWEYTGETFNAPNNEKWYAFSNDRGSQYFSEKDLEGFKDLGKWGDFREKARHETKKKQQLNT